MRMILTKTQSDQGQVPVSPIFAWNMSSQARVKVNQGGTSSGKTYGILEVIFTKLLENPGWIATIIGQDIPNLKKGALRDFEERILVANPWYWGYIAQYNKTERTFRLNNGSKMEFTSFADDQDARSGKREIAFFNEANGITWPIYQQVALRTTREIYIDYNPTAPFWVHERLINQPNVEVFYSNFLDNPFLDEVIIDEIWSLKDTDLEAWKVYGLGKTGDIAELVHEKAEVVPFLPQYMKRRAYGLDFGYRAHPTALIECGLVNEREVYLEEKIYLHRMKTRDLDITLRALGIPKTRPIYADSADGRAVDDLQERGWNIIPVPKGPDSVKYGIGLLNQYDLHITERSGNLLNERTKYRYKLDKATGNITNQVIDAFNHGWDAARYWAMMNLKPLAPLNYTWSGATA